MRENFLILQQQLYNNNSTNTNNNNNNNKNNNNNNNNSNNNNNAPLFNNILISDCINSFWVVGRILQSLNCQVPLIILIK